MKKKISLIVLLAVLIVAGVICKNHFNNQDVQDIITETQDIVLKELQVSDNTKELANETNASEDLSTTEITEIADEDTLEQDGTVDQEDIAYNGDITGNGQSLLSGKATLTYYSQADSRWANVMYSSVGDSSQTMKSSACGPTSASMIVSSSKGIILPTTMASLFVDNGYRTANNGTAWSAYSFVADYFGFNEFYSTSLFDNAMSYLKQKKEDGSNKYYIICSCGSGLFTTGGHYICLMADDNGTITVYDPYLYNGKFNTASRRNAGVVVSGNTAYVSESSFRSYANYKNFWIYSNDSDTSQDTTYVKQETSYVRYVSTSSANLNVRNNPNGTIVGKLSKGTQVTVYETSGNWSRIGTNRWVSSSYLSSVPVSVQASTQVTNSTNTSNGNYKITASSLRIRKSATTNSKQVGSYVKGTIVNVTSITGNWGKTNKGYICLSYATKVSTTTSNTSSTTYKRLNAKCTLYSKSSLSGTKYTYLAGTQVKVLNNISTKVAYVYVVKTGRYAYINKNYLQ